MILQHETVLALFLEVAEQVQPNTQKAQYQASDDPDEEHQAAVLA